MIKVNYIEDTDSYIVDLPPRSYQVMTKDGVYNISGQKNLEIKGLKEIREISETKVHTHYEDKDGVQMSIEQYEEDKKDLLKNVEHDDYEHIFKDLDEEYKYKKFLKRWTAVHRNVVQYGDPIPFETFSVKLETGNEFITSLFSVGGDASIYVYDKLRASIFLVREVMGELNVPYAGDEIFSDKSGGKVAWSNSTHSGIRYAKLGGDYIFGEEWDFSKYPISRGTLQELEKQYEQHRTDIRRIIKSKYNAKYGQTDDVKLKNFTITLVGELNGIYNRISEIDVKQKSWDKWQKTKREILDFKNKAEEILAGE